MEKLMPLMAGMLAAVAVWLAGRAMPGRASPRGAAASKARVQIALLAAALAIGRGLPGRVLAYRWVDEACHACADLAVRLLGERARAKRACAGLAVLLTLASGVAGAVVAWSPEGLAIGFAAFPVMLITKGTRASARRSRALEEAMPEAFNALAVSLGSGHSLTQALRFVGNHADEPVRTEFMRASFEMECGASAADALDALLDRLPAPGLELVTLALKASQRTGAPLKDLLAQASGMVGERIELARRLEVKTAQARMSARLVAAMPAGMIGALTLLSPDFRAGLATPVGSAAVALALVLNCCAWIAIKRIMKVGIV